MKRNPPLSFMVLGALALATSLPGFAAIKPNPAAAADAVNVTTDSSTPPTGEDLARLEPRDEAEAALIADPKNEKGLVLHAIELSQEAAADEDEMHARETRLRALVFVRAAIAAGSTHPILQLLTAETNPDGSEVPKHFDNDPEIDRLLQLGEKCFGRRDFDGALAEYNQVLAIDPRNYRAALFAADVHFSKHDYAESARRFEVAIAIDPNAEVAHRYRGDCQMQLGDFDAALDSYLDALIAAPYERFPRQAMVGWLRATGHTPGRLKTGFPEGDLAVDQGKITLKVPTGSGPLELAYLTARQSYLIDQKVDLSHYRHSLAEETFALQAMLQIAAEFRKKDPADQSLASHAEDLALLGEMREKGLLEAHILLDRTTRGLAEDYAPYRAKNRRQLTRYLREFWAGEK